MFIRRMIPWILLLAVILTAVPACSELPGQSGAAEDPGTESDAGSEALPDGAVKITRPDLLIFTEAGYDSSDTGTLLPPGVYTIVEETKDADGIRWGKLKSGAGWIDLDKAAAPAHIPLTAESASETKLNGLTYTEYVQSDSRYSQQILFRAHENLTGIRFSALQYLEDSFESIGKEFTMAEMRAGEGLLVSVIFPGDLSMFGITCTHAAGAEHRYMLYISGRNGSLIMEEYKK